MFVSLLYACTKLRHYLLSNTRIVVCQTDVLKHMLQKPILSGRIGKWAYVLVEYDLDLQGGLLFLGPDKLEPDLKGVYLEPGV